MTSEGMSKKPQVLQIDPPHEISFKGPFKDVVTSYLKLTNPSDDSVCFKVKTTAPKRYNFRPPFGIIAPKQVAVRLQPTDDGSAPDEHKFVVQTCVAPKANKRLETIWQSVESGDLMHSWLRVTFLHDAAGDSVERSQTDAFSDSPANAIKKMGLTPRVFIRWAFGGGVPSASAPPTPRKGPVKPQLAPLSESAPTTPDRVDRRAGEPIAFGLNSSADSSSAASSSTHPQLSIGDDDAPLSSASASPAAVEKGYQNPEEEGRSDAGCTEGAGVEEGQREESAVRETAQEFRHRAATISAADEYVIVLQMAADIYAEGLVPQCPKEDNLYAVTVDGTTFSVTYKGCLSFACNCDQFEALEVVCQHSMAVALRLGVAAQYRRKCEPYIDKLHATQRRRHQMRVENIIMVEENDVPPVGREREQEEEPMDVDRDALVDDQQLTAAVENGYQTLEAEGRSDVGCTERRHKRRRLCW